MTTEEIWKPVVGWEGFYEVSNLGRIKSVPRISMRGNGNPLPIRERIMALHPDSRGRMMVRFQRPGLRKMAWVHREVLKAFTGPAPEGQEARHLNDVKSDNRLINLAWGTRTENMDDLVRNGKHFQASKTHCPQGHPYDEENTRREERSPGRYARECRACSRDYYHRKKRERGERDSK